MGEAYDEFVNLPETLWNFTVDAGNWLINDGLDHASNFFCGFGDVVSCGLTKRYREGMGWDSFQDTGSAMYTAGAVAGTVESVALGVVSPCGAAGGAGTAIRALNGMQAVGNGLNLYDNVGAGNYGAAAFDALGLAGNVGQIFRACFAAGTPLLTPDGAKPIEQFRVGDVVLSSPEHDPAAPVEPRRVEEVFERVSPLLELTVGGQRIRTTGEHPFYVEGHGWVKCFELAPGDLLRGHDGRLLPVESVTDRGEIATVYNLRIAEYHTYYVGEPLWGFSVWSHNAKYQPPGGGAGDHVPNAQARAIPKLQPGDVKIGFVDRYGKLIGELYDAKVGHSIVVDFVEGLRARVAAGDAFAVTLGKNSAGEIWAFGSQNFGRLPERLQAVVRRLVE